MGSTCNRQAKDAKTQKRIVIILIINKFRIRVLYFRKLKNIFIKLILSEMSNVTSSFNLKMEIEVINNRYLD